MGVPAQPNFLFADPGGHTMPSRPTSGAKDAPSLHLPGEPNNTKNDAVATLNKHFNGQLPRRGRRVQGGEYINYSIIGPILIREDKRESLSGWSWRKCFGTNRNFTILAQLFTKQKQGSLFWEKMCWFRKRAELACSNRILVLLLFLILISYLYFETFICYVFSKFVTILLGRCK